MGAADIIPGVSGGTIALITGIYDRLIFALKSINPVGLLSFLKGDYKLARRYWTKIDYSFLIPLVLGIGFVLFAGAEFITGLLTVYPIYMYSFFSGLILASGYNLYLDTESEKSMIDWSLLLGGLALIVWLLGTPALSLPSTLPFVFLSGAVAICAMILPGVSGAFLLLMLGQYEYMLNALSNVTSHYPVLFIFILGAGVGLLTFVRVLSYLLRTRRRNTLALLVGLMIGALRRPIQIIISETGNIPFLSQEFIVTLSLAISSAVIGAFLVGLLHSTAEKMETG